MKLRERDVAYDVAHLARQALSGGGEARRGGEGFSGCTRTEPENPDSGRDSFFPPLSPPPPPPSPLLTSYPLLLLSPYSSVSLVKKTSPPLSTPHRLRQSRDHRASKRISVHCSPRVTPSATSVHPHLFSLHPPTKHISIPKCLPQHSPVSSSHSRPWSCCCKYPLHLGNRFEADD